MKLRSVAALILLIAILPVSQFGFSAVTGQQSIVYTVKLSSPSGNMGTGTMQAKGSNFAWETVSGPLKVKIINNKDGVFLINPMRPVIGKYPAKTGREYPEWWLPGPTGDVKAFLTARKAVQQKGTLQVGGVSCVAYSYQNKYAASKSLLYVNRRSLSPVKLIVTGKAKWETLTAVYTSYKPGATVADSAFQLPKGVKIRPMPTLRKIDRSKLPK